MVDDNVINICIGGILLPEEINYLKDLWDNENLLFICNTLNIDDITAKICSFIKDRKNKKANIYFISNLVNNNEEILHGNNENIFCIEKVISRLDENCVNKNDDFLIFEKILYIFVNHEDNINNITTTTTNNNTNKIIIQNNNNNSKGNNIIIDNIKQYLHN